MNISLSAQSLVLKTNIPSPLQESSGLLYWNGRLITHTDSGGQPVLYEMDTTNGTVTREVIIQNADHVDWEDIAMDQDYIYIGDFGNNQGVRTNLRIYKILKQHYLTKDTVLADTIRFNYADQTNFTPSTFSTNFDAEALIALGDSLYIFTKNWGNRKTNIYPVSKNPGQYTLTKTDSIDAQGWITGADYDSAIQQILLIGYTFNTAFYIRLTAWQSLFSSGTMVRGILQPNSSIQIEGVTRLDSFRYLISSENFQSTVSQLHLFDYRFPVSTTNLFKSDSILIYPNPTRDFVYIDAPENANVDLFDAQGRLIQRTKGKKIDVRFLTSGTYFIHVHLRNNLQYQKLIIL